MELKFWHSIFLKTCFSCSIPNSIEFKSLTQLTYFIVRFNFCLNSGQISLEKEENLKRSNKTAVVISYNLHDFLLKMVRNHYLARFFLRSSRSLSIQQWYGDIVITKRWFRLCWGFNIVNIPAAQCSTHSFSDYVSKKRYTHSGSNTENK